MAMRDKLTRAADRTRVAELYCTGASFRAIAGATGLAVTTVRRDVDAVLKDWQAEQQVYMDKAVTAELAKLNKAEAAAWAGWERSCQDVVEKVKEVRPDDEGGMGAGKLVERTRGQAGDASFLNTIMRIIDRRCRLLGLDAPAKTELSGEVGFWGPLFDAMEYLDAEDAGANGANGAAQIGDA